MLKSTNTGFLIIFTLVFLGCEEQQTIKTVDTDTEKSQKKELVAKENRSVESSLLEEAGLLFEGDKIIIDMNKTANFFESVEKRIEKKVNEVDINVTRDMGVLISDEQISVDLNKTKNLLESLSGLFAEIIEEINATTY